MNLQGQTSGGDGADTTLGLGDAHTTEFEVLDAGSTGGSDAWSASGSGTGGEIKDTVRGTVQEVQDTAGEVVSQAQDTASRVIDQVRQTASYRVEDQKSRAAEGVASVADAVQQVSRNLPEQGAVAEYMDRAAWQLQQFSEYLATRDVRDLVVEVEHFARRQPTMFLAGGLLLGMLGARFLKSSARQLEVERTSAPSGGRSLPQVTHFTTQGNYTVEGRSGEGLMTDDYDSGDTIRSTYVVSPREDSSEG